MRVLWITNYPLGKMRHLLGLSTMQSGTWILAAQEALDNHPEIRLGIATTMKRQESVSFSDNGTSYYCLNIGDPFHIKKGISSNIKKWKEITEDFKPDLINIWGTEFPMALDIIEASAKIPKVVYIQGVMSSINRYFDGRLTKKEMCKYLGVLDRIKLVKYRIDAHKIAKQESVEKEIVSQVKNVISDNEWCFQQYKRFLFDLRFYTHSLPISNIFAEENWTIESIRRHTVFCVAGRTPYKGLHSAIRAIELVKREFPDVRLFIPGSNEWQNKSFKSYIRRPPYLSYLSHMIEDLDLSDNIVFTGLLKAEDMPKYMSKSHAFIMPSCVENHSSTLREAMTVGTPSVSSYVGSVPEYIDHGENGFLYRYEEYEMLAEYICKIFRDDELATRFSENARKAIKDKYPEDITGNKLVDIYEDILNQDQVKI